MLKKNILFLVVLLIFTATNLQAIPAYPYPVVVKQPDGVEVTIQMHGDEFFSYLTTETGELVAKDAEGYYTYAEIDPQGVLVPTTQRLGYSRLKAAPAETLDMQSELFRQRVLVPALTKAEKRRTEARAMLPGHSGLRSSTQQSMRALVILVNFKDTAFLTPNPQQAFYNMLNQSGYNANGGTGSAKDFYVSNSKGEFVPQFDVYGPVTLPQNMAYYGANSGGEIDVNATKMIVDACKLANQLYPDLDFSAYANNNPTMVDNIYVFYAGYGENVVGVNPNTIWPHQYTVYNESPKVVLDGVTLATYACSAEFRGSSGNVMSGIGTFTHEFGHVLGLPDLYDADGTVNGSGSGLGFWSTMASGPYLNNGNTPPNFSMVERYYLGWETLNPLLPGSVPADTTIYPLTSENGKAYRVNTPVTNDFYTLETRKKEGWDAYLPGEGMLVYHVDLTTTANLSIIYGGSPYTVSASELWQVGYTNVIANHQCLDLIRANNSVSVYAGNPFPGSTNKTSILATGFKSWSGSSPDIQLTNIRRNTDGSVSFTLAKPGSTGISSAESSASNVLYTVGKNLYLTHPAVAPARVQVYDVGGCLQVSGEINAESPVYIPQPGIYIVKVVVGEQAYTKKVVIR